MATREGLVQRKVPINLSEFKIYYDLTRIESWTKSRLIEAFDYHRNKLGISISVFCQQWQLSRSAYSSYRYQSDSSKGRSRTIIEKFIIQAVQDTLRGVPEPELVETELGLSEKEVAGWTRAQLLEEYNRRWEKGEFSHRSFCRGMGINESTFQNFRSSRTEISPSSEQAIREYLVRGFPTSKTEHPSDDISQVDRWIWSFSLQKIIVLVDGDQTIGNLNLLKTSLMPPSDMVLFIVFIKDNRFLQTVTSWKDFPNVIVRSSRSTDKNAVDFAISIEATRIGLLYPFLSQWPNTIFIATNDKFAETTQKNLAHIGIQIQIIDTKYHHLGLYLNRYLGTLLDEIPNDPVFKAVEFFGTELSLDNDPAPNRENLSIRMKVKEMIIPPTVPYTLFLGELKERGYLLSL